MSTRDKREADCLKAVIAGCGTIAHVNADCLSKLPDLQSITNSLK